MKPTLFFYLFLLSGCQQIAPTNINRIEEQRNVNNQSEIDKSILPSNYEITGFSKCPIDREALQTLIHVKNGFLIPNSNLGNTVNNTSLSIEEMNQWLHVFSRMENSFPPAVFNIDDERQVSFFIFDGTWNDKDNGEPNTVPAKLHHQLIQSQDHRVKTHYYHGVGTRTTFIKELSEGVTGNGAEERAIQALDELKAQTEKTGIAPHVYSIGFSRGAASARHFLNLVDDYYFQEKSFHSSENLLFSKPRLYSMLFDTVATGQLDNLRLEIPLSTMSVIHFVATSEERTHFPITRINVPTNDLIIEETIVEVDLPGVHSDIGGGYGDTLEKLSHSLANLWLEKQGIYLPSIDYDIQALLNMGRNDSRWLPLGKIDSNNKRKESPNKVTEQFTLTDPNIETDLNEILERIALAESNMETNLNEMLERAALLATSATQALLRQRQKIDSGEKQTFQGLVINLYPKDYSLKVNTNCPESVSINKNEGVIEVLGQPFIALTPEYLKQLRSTYGLINTYPVPNKKNYIPSK